MFSCEACDKYLGGETKLLKCVTCKFVYYCRKECQTNDWPMHTLECAFLVGRFEGRSLAEEKKDSLNMGFSTKYPDVDSSKIEEATDLKYKRQLRITQISQEVLLGNCRCQIAVCPTFEIKLECL